MAVARLSSILSLLLHVQFIHGQQVNLGNNPNQILNNPVGLMTQETLQRNTGPNLLANNVNQIQNNQNISPNLNLQKLNLQQQGSLQQQNPTAGVTNLQFIGQPNLIQNYETPFGGLSINAKLSGVPKQISQNDALSKQVISNIPSILSNPCASKSLGDQITVARSQESLSNIPMSVVDRSPISGSLPVSASSPGLYLDLTGLNNQPSLSSLQSTSNAATACYQNIPIQNQQISVPLQNSLIVENQSKNSQNQLLNDQNQIILKPTQSQISVRTTQPNVASVQNYPPLLSLFLSQPPILSPQPKIAFTPYPISTNVLNAKDSGQGSKSSSLKAWLPLLFNLLKEKYTNCGRRNYNCRCTNNNNKMEQPVIYSGYSNQMKYGQLFDEASTALKEDSDELNNSDSKQKVHRKYKNIKNVSEEAYEEDDSDYIDYNDD